jgi:uncharacterized protein YkwD
MKTQKTTKYLKNLLLTSLLTAGMFFVADYALAADLEDEIVSNVNIERQKQEKSILTRSKALDKAAMLKAQDMVGNNYFAHTSPTGIDPWHWIGEVDYQYKYAGENLAMDFKTASAVHKAWMDSPTHKENIIAEKYTEIGVAVVSGIVKEGEVATNVAVQFFATPFVEESFPAQEQKKEEVSSEIGNEIDTSENGKIEILEASVRPWEGEIEDEMLIYTKVSAEVEKVTAIVGKEMYQLEKLSGDKYMNLVKLEKENLEENKIVIRVDINEEKAIFHQIPKYQYLEYLEKEETEKEEKQAIIASVKDVSAGIGNNVVSMHNVVLAGFVMICLVMIANIWILEKEEEKLLAKCQADTKT